MDMDDWLAALRPHFSGAVVALRFDDAVWALLTPEEGARLTQLRDEGARLKWIRRFSSRVLEPNPSGLDIEASRIWHNAASRLVALLARGVIDASGGARIGISDDFAPRARIDPIKWVEWSGMDGLGARRPVFGADDEFREILVHGLKDEAATPHAVEQGRPHWPMKSPAGRKKVHDWRPFHQEMLRFAAVEGLTTKAELQRHMKAWADQFLKGPGDKAIEDEVSDYWPPGLPEVRGP